VTTQLKKTIQQLNSTSKSPALSSGTLVWLSLDTDAVNFGLFGLEYLGVGIENPGVFLTQF